MVHSGRVDAHVSLVAAPVMVNHMVLGYPLPGAKRLKEEARPGRRLPVEHADGYYQGRDFDDWGDGCNGAFQSDRLYRAYASFKNLTNFPNVGSPSSLISFRRLLSKWAIFAFIRVQSSSMVVGGGMRFSSSGFTLRAGPILRVGNLFLQIYKPLPPNARRLQYAPGGPLVLC